MNLLKNGVIQFDDTYELTYNLFNEIGLSINQKGYVYDQDTGIELKYKDKYIKATFNIQPIYAGKNDIIFDPAHNFNLMVTLFGYYIDKCSANGEINFRSQYIEDMDNQKIDNHKVIDGKTKQRVVVQLVDGRKIPSAFYTNLYLGFVDCIFKLSNVMVDLSNLDNEI